jgi:hypothetical protein
MLKFYFKVARWALHTKNIIQGCQHSSCRPTYHTCYCVTDATSQTRILLDTLAVAQSPAFPWTRRNIFAGNRHCFFTDQLRSPQYLALFL